MKKLIIILFFLVSFLGYSQDIKDTSGFMVYVNGEVYSGPHNKANALEKILQAKKEYPTLNDSLFEALSFGKMTFKFPKSYFDVTIEGENLDKHYKDTTLKGMLINRIHEKRVNKFYKVFFYTKDSVNNETSVIRVQTKDSTALDCETCKFLPSETYINLRTHYEEQYVKYQEFEEFDNGFKIDFHLIRSQDSVELRTQTYANDFWDFWHREGITKEEMYKKSFYFLSDNPGDGLGDPGTESYTGTILRRHTHYSKNRFCQIMAIQKDTGFVIILDPDENTDFK